MEEESGNGNSLGGLILLVVIILAGVWAYNSWFKADNWKGLYEAPSANMAQSAGEFSSSDECRNWLQEKKNNPGDGYGFECGKNCTPPTSEFGSYRCEETFDY